MPSPPVVLVDVTDTLSSPWSAGIQRVVRGVTGALAERSDVRLVPIVRVDGSQRFRTLVGDEPDRLAHPPDGVRPAAPPLRSRPWLEALDAHAPPQAMRVARAVVRPLRALQYRLRDERRRVVAERRYAGRIVDRHEPGTVLLELDAVWNQVGVDRSRWYRRLRADGVRVVPFVHDLLPLEHPDWFVPSLVEVFDASVRTQLLAADVVLTNSEATAASVRTLAATLGRRGLGVVPVELGADVAPRTADEAGESGRADVPARVVLVVGTVEPRKNHRILLEAWDRLGDARPADAELVVVGRPGWRNEDVVARLRGATGSGVRWLEDADDAALAACYRRADLVAVPSLTEGYGLPVVEALGAGVPVISSDGGALRALGERAPTAVELLDPDDVAAWAAALERHLTDAAHHQRARRAVADVEVPGWSDTAAAVVAAVGALQAPPDRG